MLFYRDIYCFYNSNVALDCIMYYFHNLRNTTGCIPSKFRCWRLRYITISVADESPHIQSMQARPCDARLGFHFPLYDIDQHWRLEFRNSGVLNRFPIESPSCLLLLITRRFKFLYVLRFLGRMYREGSNWKECCWDQWSTPSPPLILTLFSFVSR